jgi:hypothetical protein
MVRRRCCRNSSQPIRKSRSIFTFSDATVDLIGEGFDAGLRIRGCRTSLIGCGGCSDASYTVAAPSYLKRYGHRRIRCISRIKCSATRICRHPTSGTTPTLSEEAACVRPDKLRVKHEALLPSVVAVALHFPLRFAGLYRRRFIASGGRSDPERLEAAERRRASGNPPWRFPRPARVEVRWRSFGEEVS